VAPATRRATRAPRRDRGRFAMTDDSLRDLAKELPWDRPEMARRDAVRSSLLVAANESDRLRTRRRSWIPIVTFVAGALAAAAVAVVIVRPNASPDRELSLVTSPGQITASPAARIDQ